MPERRKKKNLKSSKKRLSRPVLKKKKVAAKKTVRSTPKKGAEEKKKFLPVFDMAGRELETFAIDPSLQEGSVHSDLVYQAVRMYQANAREGTASTKDRGHVRGGGKKPWRQKGTGQARHGSRRSPLWRGGGTTFGPMPRDYSYALPIAMRRRAMVESVKEKVANGKLIFVKGMTLAAPRTRDVAKLVSTFKLEKPLFLLEQRDTKWQLASRNIPNVSLKDIAGVNALDVLLAKECVLTKEAYTGLLKRLKS